MRVLRDLTNVEYPQEVQNNVNQRPSWSFTRRVLRETTERLLAIIENARARTRDDTYANFPPTGVSLSVFDTREIAPRVVRS